MSIISTYYFYLINRFDFPDFSNFLFHNNHKFKEQDFFNRNFDKIN